MIHICVPGIPPTSNNAYLRLKGSGKVVLAKEGTRYKNETRTYIARFFPQELKFFEPHRPYSIITQITFPNRGDLICETWPKSANRYQKLDASNRIKLFEDAFAEAIGIDDSHTFFYGIGKYWCTGKEEMNLWAWCPEVEKDPIHELLRDLRSTCT